MVQSFEVANVQGFASLGGLLYKSRRGFWLLRGLHEVWTWTRASPAIFVLYCS